MVWEWVASVSCGAASSLASGRPLACDKRLRCTWPGSCSRTPSPRRVGDPRQTVRAADLLGFGLRCPLPHSEDSRRCSRSRGSEAYGSTLTLSSKVLAFVHTSPGSASAAHCARVPMFMTGTSSRAFYATAGTKGTKLTELVSASPCGAGPKHQAPRVCVFASGLISKRFSM